MFILLWRGWGWTVPATVVTSFLLMQIVIDAITSQGTYESNSRLFGTLSMVIAAAIIYAISDWRNKVETPRKLRDESTGQRVVLNYKSSLFFISLRVWSYILLGSAAFIALLG